jgi:hypothetical protein
MTLCGHLLVKAAWRKRDKNKKKKAAGNKWREDILKRLRKSD